jgi:hypothetical protein
MGRVYWRMAMITVTITSNGDSFSYTIRVNGVLKKTGTLTGYEYTGDPFDLMRAISDNENH